MNEKRASIRFIERCYKLYEQKMYHVAYCILRDEGLAEDAVQEAFLKLMKSNVDFKDAKSDECKQYIITIIKHASIDIYNRKKREQELIFSRMRIVILTGANQKLWTNNSSRSEK